MNVDPRTLAALNLIAKRLRLRDIGINPERREIYLLGGPRTLNSTLTSPLLVSWQHQRGHTFERTWDRLEVVLLEILRDTNVPQPGVMSEYGPWQGGPGPRGGFVSDWSVFPIPAPGGPQSSWWSARTGKHMPPVRVPQYSLCGEEKLNPGNASGPAMLQLSGSELPPAFVSHGIALEDLRRPERCGGLLWPSLAVTWKVPPSYGDLVLIADARLLTMFLPPTGRRDHRFLFTASDSWSPTGGELARLEKAINWELRGDRKWWSGDRDYDDGGYGQRSLQSELVFGSRDIDDLIGGFAPDVSKRPLRNMAQFWRRFRYLVKIHTRRCGIYEYETREELLAATDDHGDFYNYLELKVRGVLSLSSFVACLYPRRLSASANRFLDKLGFQGWRIPFRWNGPLEKATSSESPQRTAWASAATNALLRWAENPCGSGVEIPDVMKADYASARHYSPIAEYSAGYDHGYGGHFGWRAAYCPKPTTERVGSDETGD